ncbi:selenide, water dikinase SelD [Aquirufa regiilacus]|uniref:Selenide, water dikinase n=1 Tax=Aquirufa regiilacus TaxID=3024868 RepID=A0ABU3TPW7_9BACT|nr:MULTISPECIES: selenide, water dikinase SelD [unclassified Aquirufa]MDT8887428.1 selenide, water dikinase SelD [Aquirufa sp. LEPPI-3A]MDU0807899.1 selenide, water dikinase SelD [Aquirufa sp. LEOWEIH-7C]
MQTNNEPIKLTAFSHGAGCGCKISPQILDTILKSNTPKKHHPLLLVGNESRDDAAVFDWQNGEAVISTTDFFMPIVDDPFDFGKIAATNAISDIYAMGGTPLMAIAILGWPIEKLAPEIAAQVLEGGRAACAEAGIPLAGGHSIDSPEPIFGLAVTGKVKKEELKQNDTATEGCILYLTKPLGVGILTTGQKRGIVSEGDLGRAVKQMSTLNSFGAHLGPLSYVKSLTDVTGFGLFGHLVEMADGSGLSAKIDFESLPLLPNIAFYLDQKCFPGGTSRNLASYGHRLSDEINERQQYIGADPQTSGGLLIAVEAEHTAEFESFASSHGLELSPIGELTKAKDKAIYLA